MAEAVGRAKFVTRFGLAVIVVGVIVALTGVTASRGSAVGRVLGIALGCVVGILAAAAVADPIPGVAAGPV
jgi:hypothetical protein